jgi:hypothetical protein
MILACRVLRSLVGLAHVFTATAINLIRLDAWWTRTPPGRARTSHLTTLGLTLAA